MNRPAAVAAFVPPTVVTRTSTVAGVCGGVTALICVALAIVKLAAGTTPNLTEVAPENPVPVMVTVVPPECGPLVGLRPVTAGAATYVNLSVLTAGLVPAGVVTLTSTVPAAWAGLVAKRAISETTLKEEGGGGSEVTAVAPVKEAPAMAITVPPLSWAHGGREACHRGEGSARRKEHGPGRSRGD